MAGVEYVPYHIQEKLYDLESWPKSEMTLFCCLGLRGGREGEYVDEPVGLESNTENYSDVPSSLRLLLRCLAM